MYLQVKMPQNGRKKVLRENQTQKKVSLNLLYAKVVR